MNCSIFPNDCIIFILFIFLSYLKEWMNMDNGKFFLVFVFCRWCRVQRSANEARSKCCRSAAGSDRGSGAGSRRLSTERKRGRRLCHSESLACTRSGIYYCLKVGKEKKKRKNKCPHRAVSSRFLVHTKSGGDSAAFNGFWYSLSATNDSAAED